MELSKEEKQQALENATEMLGKLNQEGGSGLLEGLQDAGDDLLSGFDLGGLLPDRIRENLDISSVIKNKDASGTDPCENIQPSPCNRSGGMKAQHKVKPKEGSEQSNPLQDGGEGKKEIMDKVKELGKEAEKKGLTDNGADVEENGDETIIDQAMDFIPKNIKNLGEDLLGEDFSPEDIPGADLIGDLGNALGIFGGE